jgi:single-strand DNA-binding protein
MRSVNKVMLIGNVTRDPQLKVTTNGQPMTTFGIATNRKWVTSGGEEKSMAEYHDVVAWSRLAELCDKYLKKGKLVYLEGYLKTRNWEDDEGGKMYRTEIIVHDMIMLNKREDSANEDIET